MSVVYLKSMDQRAALRIALIAYLMSFILAPVGAFASLQCREVFWSSSERIWSQFPELKSDKNGQFAFRGFGIKAGEKVVLDEVLGFNPALDPSEVQRLHDIKAILLEQGYAGIARKQVDQGMGHDVPRLSIAAADSIGGAYHGVAEITVLAVIDINGGRTPVVGQRFFDTKLYNQSAYVGSEIALLAAPKDGSVRYFLEFEDRTSAKELDLLGSKMWVRYKFMEINNRQKFAESMQLKKSLHELLMDGTVTLRPEVSEALGFSYLSKSFSVHLDIALRESAEVSTVLDLFKSGLSSLKQFPLPPTDPIYKWEIKKLINNLESIRKENPDAFKEARLLSSYELFLNALELKLGSSL